MKRILAVIALLLPLAAFAQTEKASLVRHGNNMDVVADFNLDPALLKGVKAFVLVPQITDGEKTVELAPVGMYSKDKFYPNLQALGVDGNAKVFAKKDLPATVNYTASVPYERWMDGAMLQVVHKYDGCCGDSGVEKVDTVAKYREAPINYTPAYREMDPSKMVKSETVVGLAVVDFPVNKTVAIETYHNNAAELGKITESIDRIKSAKETVIQSVVISGTSSPEGSLAVNTRLSEGRTQTVYDYVVNQYDFPAGVIKAESVPENWEGLREFVAGSSLRNKEAILGIIDGDLAADAKESKIRNTYPSDWSTIRKNCLPYLRCTKYTISFEAKDYEATETKVDMAYNAMRDGDFVKAAEHLSTAGDDAEANYARGTLAASICDWPTATRYFQKAVNQGLEEARPALEEVSRYQYMRECRTCQGRQ